MSSSFIRFCVITVSDSCIEGTRTDESGALLEQLVTQSTKFNSKVTRFLVPDDSKKIEQALLHHLGSADVILTTGGTGLAPRDVTPEATKKVIERECMGIVVALLNRSLQATPMAALTRLTAGIKDSTLIINLPGSSKAVKECYEVLDPILLHAFQLMQDKREPVQQEHREMAFSF